MLEKLEEAYGIKLLEKLNSDYAVSNYCEFELENLIDNPAEVTFFKINELTFEENEKNPRREAFENVLGTLRIEGINFIYLILGSKNGVSFYFGIVKNLKEDAKLSMSIREIGDTLLKSGIQGNFRGSKITKLTPAENREILEKIKDSRRYGSITGVPGINETDGKSSFQGVDRLTDVMLGDEFGLCILARPVEDIEIKKLERQLYEIYDKLSLFSKQNIQSSVNSSQSTGTSKGSTTSETKGKSVNLTTNKSTSTTHSTGKTVSLSSSTGDSETRTTGSNKGINTGTTETNTTGTSKNSGGSSSSSGSNESKAKGITHGNSSGTSKSISIGTTTTETETTGKNENTSEGVSTGESESMGKNESTTAGTNESINSNDTQGTGSSVSIEVQNREVQDWLKYIDEILFPLVDYGKSKGIYLTSSFLFANDNGTLIKLGNTMTSLFSGRKGNKMPLKLELLSNDDERIEYFKNLQIPEYDITRYTEDKKDALTLKSSMGDGRVAEFGNWYSANELSLIAGLPQKEVVGLSLKEEVEFGLNINSDENEETMILGNLVQSGKILDIDVKLDKKALNKHTFVTGVTGTGKTTTCQKLLLESEMPFLVIEPAKTEYRILIDEEKTKDVLIFTLGKDTVSPFRLNPFEFFEHESITSRVDMVKAAMEASFDMEAAIPQILESSMYECYKDYGWDILTNKNKKFEDPFAKGVYSFPTLEDLLEKIEIEVEKQGFDDRLKKDYIGSIKARLQGMLVGSKGMMLNVGRGIDFRELIEKKVVLEIEEIKNGAEKSLIMGFVLTNLCEALKAKYRTNRNFKHITLIEEAHRLLSKVYPGESPTKKQGVETFTDMLAEVRKYGESLIIADQIPNKLTPEILKNTNTKIVHKLFAEDDKEAIGNTISLTSEQKNFLSSLNTGRAIVFSQGWDRALQVQIKRDTNTTGDRYVEDWELTDRIIDFYQENGIILGLNFLDKKATLEEFEICRLFSANQKTARIYKNGFEKSIYNFEEFKELNTEIFQILETLEKILSKNTVTLDEKELNLLKKYIGKIGTEEFRDIILKNYYINSEIREELYNDIKGELLTMLEGILKDGTIKTTNRIRGKYKKR